MLVDIIEDKDKSNTAVIDQQKNQEVAGSTTEDQAFKKPADLNQDGLVCFFFVNSYLGFNFNLI